MSAATITYSRKNYMDGDVDHATYYGQFATPEVVAYVIDRVGADRLLKSTDEHMNDIPLRIWDRLNPPIDFKALSESNYSTTGTPGSTKIYYSLSDVVCISKTAARMWVAQEVAATREP